MEGTNKITMKISELKKGDKFIFNNKEYTVKQRFSDWRKNDEPYMITKCGQIFWHDELEVDKIELLGN
jgi:hypothetical protein